MTCHPPDHPFTAADTIDLGITRAQLRRLVAAGDVKHLLYGVYVPGWWQDNPETRSRAAAHVLPAGTVIADRSAASLHGIDLFDYAELDVVPDLEVVSVDGRRATRRSGLLGGQRDLLPVEITSVGGVPVTTPVRTACDVACLRGRRRAFAALEAFRTHHDLSDADLGLLLPRFRGRRGVKQLRELVSLARAGADSQPESWVAIEMYDAGFPMPAAQVWAFVPGWGMAKLENAYEHLRLAVEYDGEKHHSADVDVAHDELRRDALRRAGWIIIVVRKDGFRGPAREKWLAELAAAFAERAGGPRRRVYARGPDQLPLHRRR